MGHYACDMRPELFVKPTRRKNVAKRTMNRLDMLQSAKLLAYIADNYASEVTTDKQFAEKATAALGFEVVENHVETRRKMLKIPVHAPQRTPSIEAMFELVRELEQRVATAEKHITMMLERELGRETTKK